jgi:4-amino-4-deoxy-L-arabinose transferase-like glycosyltransferase
MRIYRMLHTHRRALRVGLLALILGGALLLRVRGLGTTGIWGDQSFTLNTAMRWVNGGPVPLASNKSSIGTVNPPMIEYLYAAALALWPDVLGVSVLTLLSGMVAVAATAWAAWRVFGARAALWAAALLALNPWAVYYSQLIWNQTMVPVFSALTLAGLLLYFAHEQRGRYLILSAVTAACMTQVHPASVVQLLAVVLVGATFWRKLRPGPLLAGGALFALSYVPYLLYERSVGWIDLRAMLELGRQPAPWSPAALLVSLDLLRGRGLLPDAPAARPFDALTTLLLVLALAYALGRVLHAAVERRRGGVPPSPEATGLYVTLLWFAVPLTFYLRSAHYLQVYYLIGQVPAHFLLLGAMLNGLPRALSGQDPPRRRAWAALVALPALALIGWQLAFNVWFQDARARRDAIQVRHVRAAIDAARDLLAEHPDCDLVVLSEGHTVERSRLSLLREFTTPERVVLADGRLAVPLPAPCAVYLDGLPGSPAAAWLAREAEPLPERAVDVGARRWRFYALPAATRATAADLSFEPGADPAWANGAALTAYRRGPVGPGATLPLTLTWSVEMPAPEVVYHLGAYLLDGEQRVVAQADGPGFDSIQWRAGDGFVTWSGIALPADLPPGDYRLALAWYTWPQVERVDLRSGGNTAFLETVTVPASP